jgi:hypothetical protein
MLGSVIPVCAERCVHIRTAGTRQRKKSRAQATLNTSTRRRFHTIRCAEQHESSAHVFSTRNILTKSSVIIRRLVLTAAGLKALASSSTANGFLHQVLGAGGGSNGHDGLSFSGGSGGGGNDPIFGAQPAYARTDDEYEDDIYGLEDAEGVEEYEDEDGEDDDDSEGGRDVESRSDKQGSQLKKAKSKDSFICESVLATNLPTGPGIPTKVSTNL